MTTPEILSQLAIETPSKIILFVIDGLGGLPQEQTGRTELEAASLPTLDRLAERSVLGLSEPVGLGISPGSGPGHLALFGFDPIETLVGRGILSALGVGFPVEASDVAARINFATVDADGNVADRRAGRISTELNRELVAKLRQIELPGVETFLETESGHRGLVVFRGAEMSDKLSDTDPQRVGVPPFPAEPLDTSAEASARVVNAFIERAREVLRDDHPANAILLRGFAKHPNLPSFPDLYKIRSAAVAVYPMYKGLARLVGMEVLETGETLADEFATVKANWDRFDFFFIHLKNADSAGEDGDFRRKTDVLENVDRNLNALLDLKPDVLVVTGDHSTPSVLQQHSWHPVPFLLTAKTIIPDRIGVFSERACARGSLGRFPAKNAMALMLASAMKLTKFGA
ncbi:MAG TPA: 2,3-bisphosphoglycerate-independent phosphoglycerate mutase [Chloroflexota bacterium]|nr:2,3-bisphosphoglycerate-independent phosphoglycerate mutase [Chloroflexota bacterium]